MKLEHYTFIFLIQNNLQMKFLLLFTAIVVLLLLTAIFSPSKVQAQYTNTEFGPVSERDVMMTMPDGMVMIFYDSKVALQNQCITLIETQNSFIVVTEFMNYTVLKENYKNSPQNYVVYEDPGNYVFWIRKDDKNGMVTSFQLNTYNPCETIAASLSYPYPTMNK